MVEGKERYRGSIIRYGFWAENAARRLLRQALSSSGAILLSESSSDVWHKERWALKLSYEILASPEQARALEQYINYVTVNQLEV